MINLVAVKKTFNGGRPNEFKAVRGVDLTIEASRVTVLKGPSGSGKTTLPSLSPTNRRPILIRHFPATW